MPRLPAIRVSYQNDANYLLRLVDAIERDTKRPAEWRKQLATETRALALKFIGAPEASPVEEKAAKPHDKNRKR